MNQDRSTTTTNSKLKEGYKQTEVGLIPEDWNVVALMSLADIKSGIAKNSNAFVSNPVLVHYLRVANVQDGFLDLSEMSQLQVNRDDIKRYAVLPGDMLMNEGGDLDKLGRGTLWSGEFNPCVHQNHVFVVRCGSKLVPSYLNSWTGTSASRRYFMLAGRQTTNLASINKTSLGQLPIALPPTKAEQEAIASTLSDIDALIESLDRLLTKKRQIKQGAMQELLRSKEGWMVKRLGEICEIGMGRTPPRLNGAFWGKGYKWLSIADLKSKVVNESKEEITSLAATDMKIIPKGTLLMSFKLSLGRLCFAGCDLFTNEAICSFNQLQANPEYLYYVLGRTDFSLYGKQAVKGYTLNKESLKLIEVNLPSPEEQIEIANILSDMDAEIESISAKLTKTRQLKQGMMHELLTGRIRLVD